MRSAATTFTSSEKDSPPDSAQKITIPRRVGSVAEWFPLLMLPLIVVLIRERVQPWIFMWLLAVAIFAGCKWQSFSSARGSRQQTSWKRSVAFLFLWPGMNANEFLDTTSVPSEVQPREWASALAKTVSGAALIWIVVRRIPQPMLAAWIGMLALILLLHFGIFQILSVAWRTSGVCAEPIMQKPLQSRSLSEFWGKRWNLGFRQLSYGWIFKPLQKTAGIALATLCAFLASGLVHDLVISLPARGGYGLPTAYFMIQAIGVLIERSAFGPKLGLGKGVIGWVWMALFAAGPAYWLFHPWFAIRVMLPFLRAIGAGC
ncbi:MAG TPA: MBOAT family protein [Candidatus Acidoferrum sp.]|nr:MBOAT family protein [Candidatus Acidoferrum sp.]